MDEIVAWRVKGFADDWILCHTEGIAQDLAEGAGNLIQPLCVKRKVPEVSDFNTDSFKEFFDPEYKHEKALEDQNEEWCQKVLAFKTTLEETLDSIDFDEVGKKLRAKLEKLRELEIDMEELCDS